jgi:hypothetical protein
MKKAAICKMTTLNRFQNPTEWPFSINPPIPKAG